jgi:hypothetical protein
MIDIFDRHKASKTPSTMAASFYFDEKSPEAKYLTELLQEEDAKLSYLCDSVIDCFYKQHKQFHKSRNTHSGMFTDFMPTKL